jgi:phage terminase large subunit
MVTSEQKTVWKAIQSPERYLREVLGATPYYKQVEMFDAVRHNRRVSVVGCNSSGKDWAAGRIVLWWMTVNYPAKVIVTGPTYRQVEDIVWNEVRSAYYNSIVPLGGHMYQTPRFQGRKIDTAEPDPEHFALGFSTSDEFNLQGFHSPNLLVIITEAHGLPQRDIDALHRLNPKCTLMTGNAFSTSGEFYESHHGKRDLYKTITISATDTPNIIQNQEIIKGMVTAQDVNDRKEEWGEDSPMYRGAVLAEFPDELEDVIIPLSFIRESMNREVVPEGEITIACDVARFGQDKTVVALCQGNYAEIIWKVQGKDLMSIAGWLGRYCEDNNVDNVVVDDTGLGGGVTDRLREVGLNGTNIIAFKGGETAQSSDRFSNKIAEAWWVMRDWVIAGGRVPNDDALIGQMSSRGYTIQSDRKISLQQKIKMAKSPDEADALAMAIYSGYSKAGMGVW